VFVDELRRRPLDEPASRGQTPPMGGLQRLAMGAALLCADGSVYMGCNIENASFGATCCAERTAIFKAGSEGNKDLEGIAIVSSGSGPAYPCGICRQVIDEFVDGDFEVICGNNKNEYKVYKFSELLPLSFKSQAVKRRE
jgi:cytidine deaminase